MHRENHGSNLKSMKKSLDFNKISPHGTHMKTKIKFPFVGRFQDYHEILDKQIQLNDVFVQRVNAKEIAFDGMYWGVFYVGRIPSDANLKEMLLKAGWHNQVPNSEFRDHSVHVA